MMNKDGERLEVANIAQGWLLTINPQLIVDAEDTQRKIATLFPALSHDDFIAKAANKSVKYAEAAHRIPDDIGMQISALKLVGVQLFRET